MIYRQKKDREKEKYYLALSSLSDIQSAITDHASLWMLADLLLKDGDIERAYHYIRFSWDETNRFRARSRSWQSADILSLIDKNYQATIEGKNRILVAYLTLISVLTLLLISAIVYIYRQMKRLAEARNHLQETNEQLKVLNGELYQMNDRLQSANLELSESNRIKEEYIGRFMSLCSSYIDKLDGYRRMVYKMEMCIRDRAEITDGIRDDPFSPVGGKQPVAYFRSPVRGIGEVEPGQPANSFSLFQNVDRIALFVRDSQYGLQESLFICNTLEPVDKRQPDAQIFPVFINRFENQGCIFKSCFPNRIIGNAYRVGVRADCLFESFPCTVVPVIHFATVFESQRVDQAKHISCLLYTSVISVIAGRK